MSQLNTVLIGLGIICKIDLIYPSLDIFILSFLLTIVMSNLLMNANASNSRPISLDNISELERIALTRDNFARPNPDTLLEGFFPAWGVVLFILSGKTYC